MDNSALRMGTGFNDGTLALIGVAILLVGFAAWSSRGPNVEKTDFALTYVGAYIVHEGSGTDLYDTGIQVRLRDSMFQNPSPLYFEHPPFEALALAPLAALPFRTAYLVWGLVNAAVLLGVVVWLRPTLYWPSEDIAYLFLWLIFAPVLVAIYQGQSSIIVMAAYGAAFIFLKKDKPIVAGAFFALALLKFQFAVPFAILCLLRRQWRFLAGFSGVGMLLGMCSLIGIGWNGVANYSRLLSQIGNSPQNVSYGSVVDMPTLHGLVFALGGHALGPIGLNITVAILSIGLLTWVTWRWAESNLEMSFAAGIAASLLCGSHMFTHDFSPLGIAMFLLAGNLTLAHKSLRLASWFILAVFWTFPFYFLFVKWHCLYIMAIVLLAFTWCCLRVVEQSTAAKTSELQTVAAG